ncbi:unnamed protein product [[Actinomadura] parvosata subsp. kistnae]|uniref:Uncharacterized protein n=1 Tax=[Actinomadura] parvosata subsp. kistnae TaxID=1909395 RepID=A0A1V0A3R4_9ACTN|nr:hypothetical protein [Nonomuraea sp. ATCC 55076]AQZ64865.1 hypothetical protein BKM31_28500 [Nonomuraea sp. ATCC 55076]SPL96074.1 unnamed protein product [Actinomadura parvosata subsp. kistnae]
MATSQGRGGRVGLVLLALGPALVAAYAGAGYVAIKAAVRAQVTGPEWAGRKAGAAGFTSLGVDTWRLTWWTALVVGLVAVLYLLFGVLLRRGSRGRTLILVVSGLLIVPYALGFGVALFNPPAMLANLYDNPDFLAGLPAWQPFTAWLLLAAGLAQAVGMVLATTRIGRAPAQPRVGSPS